MFSLLKLEKKTLFFLIINFKNNKDENKLKILLTFNMLQQFF